MTSSRRAYVGAAASFGSGFDSGVNVDFGIPI